MEIEALWGLALVGNVELGMSVSNLSEEAMNELREIFEHFDKNQNGVIESGELAALLDALGAEMTESEVATGLRALDEDGNGTIEFKEFANWWADR